MLDFNTEPYNDDFNEDNKFYRILFRPGFAVQARELTQLQTIIQNQIGRQGDFLFKQGAMVIPGQISMDTNYNYVKLQVFNSAGDVTETFVQNLSGKNLVGTSGVTAQVLTVVSADGADPTTLYVKYTAAGTNKTTHTFSDGEVLTTDDSAYTVTALTTNSVGVGSAATIQRGIYYVNGFFVLCDTQTVILDKYTNTPSYRIGLNVVESKLTPEDTGYEMLLDNAQNSYNYAAPGAHRYFIDLILAKLPVDSISDTNFIELLRTKDGQTLRKVDTTAINQIEKTLARRTYDESGNYTVSQFNIDVREHRDNNRGAWMATTAYLIGDVVTNAGHTYVATRSGTSVNIPPTHSSGTAYDGASSTGVEWQFNLLPAYNRGIYTPENGGDEAKLAIGLEPGKAYVQGYELQKISTEYVAVNKARDTVQLTDTYINSPVGNFVYVTNINAIPPFGDYSVISLYDRFTGTLGTSSGSKVGTARVRGVEWDSGTIGTQSAVYKLFLFDINMVQTKDFNKNVKQFYYNSAGSQYQDFSADIVPVTKAITGSGTTYSSYPTKGASTTVTGIGTSFQTDLTVGDYIYVGTSLVRVVTISSQNTIVVSSSITADGAVIKLVKTSVTEPSGLSNIISLPNYAVKSVRDTNGIKQIIYYVIEYFSGTTTTGGGGSCTLTINTTAGVFASEQELTNYMLVYNDSSAGGTVVLPTSISSGGTTSITFTLDSSYASKNFVVMATVKKTGSSGGERTKTLTTATKTFTSLAAATASTLMLDKADVYKINSVMMKSGAWDSEGATYSIDISDRYDLDNGQRDNFYDLGRLNLKGSFSPPSASVSITYQYFQHSTGDYFTVNSYPANIAYKDIPMYGSLYLRDSLDFRPRIDDTGSTFVGSGSSFSPSLKRGQDITLDYSYYLPRKDKIALDFSGNFFAIEGVSSLNPGEPTDPSLGMVLYKLTLEPYTFGTSNNNVINQLVDNKRYTMRDIGKLEKRIDTIEYYTSLSLLEQETKSLPVPDQTTGLDKFKNGFIVDSFTGHNTGDVNSPDYLCSIDMENNILRPYYSMENINILEKNSNDTDRAAANYKLYGDVITLPVLDHVPLVTQPYGSRLENINPFAIFTFLGNIKLNPSSDDWFEVNQLPDIVRNVEGDFNTIYSLAQKAGVIGTIWSAWQTQWSGAPQSSGQIVYDSRYGDAGGAGRDGVASTILTPEQMNARFGNVVGNGWAFRRITSSTIATQIGQSRTGVNTQVVSRIDRVTVDDRVVSTAVIPYIRQRNLLIQVKALKPNTRFYPYFDNVDVSAYCTPSSYMTYSLTSGPDFDATTNCGGLASDSARQISYGQTNLNGDTKGNVCLNIGDVLRGATSGATAVVVGRDYNSATGIKRLHLVNIIGTFVSNETISGSISGSVGTVASVPTNSTQGSNLVTNLNGEVNFVFWIPNYDYLKFRTGMREFKLLDVTTTDAQATSSARTQYSASGTLQTKQATVNAVRNADVVQNTITQNQVIVNTQERVVSDTGWFDPLAETFLVQSPGGAFLSKVDIFFATKDPAIPVTLEIRDVVNGYPGKNVLAFSKVTLKPENVNISTNNVTFTDGTTVPKYDTPTTFTFPSPVYVNDNQEYCIVLASDSNLYKVWISQMGDQIPGSSRTISNQPYAGVLFKSQNASTWTANQDQDLMFTLYRAKFDTSVTSAVEFVNDVVPNYPADMDPLETGAGSVKVRVWQPSHGLYVNSKVTLDNVDSRIYKGVFVTGTITTTTSSTAVVGVGTLFTNEIGSGTTPSGAVVYDSAGRYLGVVASVTDNTHLTLVANSAYAVSGSGFKIAPAIQGIPPTELYTTHDVTDVDIDSFVFHVTTSAKYSGYAGGDGVRTTRNISYDVLQPSTKMQVFPETKANFTVKTVSGQSIDGSETPYIIDTGFNACVVNDSNYFISPRVIASQINEDTFVQQKTLTLACQMSSSNDALSPIIDTHRTSVIAISNKVNSPSETNINIAELDNTTLFTGTIGTFHFTGKTITATDATVRGLMQTVTPGKYIVIASATTSGNNGTYLVTAQTDDGTTGTITVLRSANFASEDSASGTSFTLKNLFADEITPVGSSTISKYVSKVISLSNPSDYLRIRYSGNIPSEANVLVYYKINPVGQTLDLTQVNWTLLSPDAVLPKVQNGYPSFTDIDYTIQGLVPFDSMVVKIVMQSTNTSAVPKIKDLRIIACA